VFGGRNSGKTTLLRVAAGLLEPCSGNVKFGSRTVRGRDDRIGWIGLDPPPITDLPCAAYVALPLLGRMPHGQAQRAATDALARVNARECAEQTWADLSPSLRPLVSIAHALVQRSRALVVDDITRGLSAIERGHIVSILRQTTEETRLNVLMATSDLAVLPAAHRVHFLSEGRLVDQANGPSKRHRAIG
jgi:putative ABC transport system ATP-binding protein